MTTSRDEIVVEGQHRRPDLLARLTNSKYNAGQPCATPVSGWRHTSRVSIGRCGFAALAATYRENPWFDSFRRLACCKEVRKRPLLLAKNPFAAGAATLPSGQRSTAIGSAGLRRAPRDVAAIGGTGNGKGTLLPAGISARSVSNTEGSIPWHLRDHLQPLLRSALSLAFASATVSHSMLAMLVGGPTAGERFPVRNHISGPAIFGSRSRA